MAIEQHAPDAGFATKRPDGLFLTGNAILSNMDPEDLLALQLSVDVLTVPAGTMVVHEGDHDHDMYFIVDGRASLQRHQIDLQPLGQGDSFGELALIAGRSRAASVVALTPLTLARLTAEAYDALSLSHPAIALHLTQVVIGHLGAQLTEMTDNVGQLLMARSLPRRKDVTINVAGETRRVPMGTRLQSQLPAEVDGHPVVAGLIDQKPVSLTQPLSSDATVAPLTTAHWEGWRIYRRSVGLMLLEAASRMSPALRLRLGPSLGSAQEVQVAGTDRDLATVADELTAAMRAMVAEDLPFREEWWTVEEAGSQFAEWGWQSAARLLKVWRDAMVMLVSCGKVYAISMGPVVPSAGLLGAFRLEPRGNALVLTFEKGERLLKTALDLPDLQDREGSTMLIEHRRWLDNLGVTDVGAFNEHCVSGQVSQLIRVAEGFHEKRIGQIADAIVSRGSGVRVIGIAGPSSSGKTTFIKRLTVQLQINGINPVGISLDDYYVDRDKTPLDAAGEYDYEAFEALDIPLLQDQLRRLMRGEAVKMARYDFISGKSQPEGGPELRLHPHDVLMLEGIHGLNPGLIGDLLGHEAVFRIFVNPMTALPFDHLDHCSVSDLRLLRRIVRDRFTRGSSAADNILRWPSVRAGERHHIFPFLSQADAVFDTALIYEPAVLKVFADRYLLEVPQDHPAYPTAYRLRQLIDRFVTIYPEHVPSTSILREFIGGSGFE